MSIPLQASGVGQDVGHADGDSDVDTYGEFKLNTIHDNGTGLSRRLLDLADDQALLSELGFLGRRREALPAHLYYLLLDEDNVLPLLLDRSHDINVLVPALWHSTAVRRN